eukprot:COSAG02_NODE_2898_length_7779_cov_69.158854_3_plen_84_part_00
MAEGKGGGAAGGEKEGDLEKEMNANQWTKEEHYHFLKVRDRRQAGVRVCVRACVRPCVRASVRLSVLAGTKPACRPMGGRFEM